MQMPDLLTITDIVTGVICGASVRALRRDLQKMCPVKLMYYSKMKSLVWSDKPVDYG